MIRHKGEAQYCLIWMSGLLALLLFIKSIEREGDASSEEKEYVLGYSQLDIYGWQLGLDGYQLVYRSQFHMNRSTYATSE